MSKENNEYGQLLLKLGKGLVGAPFVSRSGKQLVAIKVPNEDPTDKRPWETFVFPASSVLSNSYGKGVWITLPEKGETRLSRSAKQGVDESGKTIWGREIRVVPNRELKRLMETYMEKPLHMNG